MQKLTTTTPGAVIQLTDKDLAQLSLVSAPSLRAYLTDITVDGVRTRFTIDQGSLMVVASHRIYDRPESRW